MVRGQLSRLSVVLILGAALTGCAEPGTQQPLADQGSSVDWLERTPTDAPQQFRTLLDDAVFGPEAPSRDRDAREVAIEACMEDKGFDYQPEMSPLPPDSADLPWAPYSAIPKSFAARHGYGVSTFIVATESVGDEFTVGVTPENAALMADAPGGLEAWVKAMHEYPAGCLASTEDVGINDRPARNEPDEELLATYDESYQELEESDRLASALTQWRECMADQGFVEYESRREIVDALLPEAYEGSPTLVEVQTRERALAVADAACADPVVQAGHQVLAELHAAIIREHPAEVADSLAGWQNDLPTGAGPAVSSLRSEVLESMEPSDVVTSY